jgi:large subunit ribosomal protein L10
MEHKAHVAQSKKDNVKRFTKLLKDNPVIGIVNMEGMPSAQLQVLRRQFRGDADIAMTKKRLLNIAIDEVKKDKPGIEKLHTYTKGMPAVIFSKTNPFSIYKRIKKSKSSAPAKPGQLSPRSIEVKAGPTPFAPGPIISELATLGFKTSVENGKIMIRQDHIIVKEGQAISEGVASMLLRLDIKPMEVGLDVVAVYEGGIVYEKKVLDVDEVKLIQQIGDAGRYAFNLAIEAAYPTKDTAELLIQKAYRDAKSVSIESVFATSATIGDILARATREAQAVQKAGGI